LTAAIFLNKLLVFKPDGSKSGFLAGFFFSGFGSSISSAVS
jgi:hypothetical protein